MKNVPHLRFKEFSGEWQIKKVGSICDSIVPGRNKPIMFDGDIPWVTTPDIEQSGSVFFSKKSLNITRAEAKKIGSKIVPKHSVIISCVGDLGLVAIAGVDLVINQQLHAFIASDTIYYKFLLYSLLMQKPYMEKVATKTAVPYMNKENCNSIPICHPEIIEQTKIADFLTAIDDRISQLAQKCELLEQYKKGVMQKIFSQELRFKDEEGREFPAWEEKRLGDVADIIGGGTPDTSVKEYWGGNIQWFTPTEIKSKFARNSIRTITDKGLKNSAAKKLPVGTLLFSSRATIGDVAIALNECTTNQGFQSFIVSSVNSNEFVYYWVLNNRKLFLEKSSGSTFIEISKKEIEKIPIKRPCIEEQTKIAGFLSAVDEKISQAQAKLEAVKQYKQGLLQQMFV